jgi:hypothetical protein
MLIGLSQVKCQHSAEEAGRCEDEEMIEADTS